ncbi:hypothetical protein DFJ73DRAFT_883390 [Zopfochytrium polystomum]|nr:hypothetical protein DFJ73DRAFT_883390 [Zopfochytrium polystomum]
MSPDWRQPITNHQDVVNSNAVYSKPKKRNKRKGSTKRRADTDTQNTQKRSGKSKSQKGQGGSKKRRTKAVARNREGFSTGARNRNKRWAKGRKGFTPTPRCNQTEKETNKNDAKAFSNPGTANQNSQPTTFLASHASVPPTISSIHSGRPPYPSPLPSPSALWLKGNSAGDEGEESTHPPVGYLSEEGGDTGSDGGGGDGGDVGGGALGTRVVDGAVGGGAAGVSGDGSGGGERGEGGEDGGLEHFYCRGCL